MFNKAKKRKEEIAQQDALQKEKERLEARIKYHNEIDEKYRIMEERRLKIQQEFEWLEEMNKKIQAHIKKK